MRNRHIMFITIEHRNLEIWKHITTSCSGRKPFYYLWVKGFDVRWRDTIFYTVLFIWPSSWAALIGCKFASRLWAPKVDPSRLVSNSQLSNFLQILTQASTHFRCVTSSTPCHLVSSLSIVTSEWHVCSVRAHALPPASRLHLTNPCAEPKGSQPN